MAGTPELRDMPVEKVGAHLRDLRREALGLRFQHSTGELENTARLGAARRELARALTIARERDIPTE